jgi:hypothetical protein
MNVKVRYFFPKKLLKAYLPNMHILLLLLPPPPPLLTSRPFILVLASLRIKVHSFLS